MLMFRFSFLYKFHRISWSRSSILAHFALGTAQSKCRNKQGLDALIGANLNTESDYYVCKHTLAGNQTQATGFEIIHYKVAVKATIARLYMINYTLPQVTLFTDKNRQEPTRGIFMHYSIKILPYVCVIYPN